MKRISAEQKLTRWGLVNILSPLPCLLFVVTLTWLLMAIVHFEERSTVAQLLPLAMLAHPISCILGFLYGLKHRKTFTKKSHLCMGLSVGGFVAFMLLVAFIAYLGHIG